MAYDSTFRRRLRQIGRWGRVSVDPRSYPRVRMIPAYWWDGHRNFGDALTPWLLRAHGVVPVLATPARARMVGVGSILEHLPEDYDGYVWSTGLMHNQPIKLPRAHFLAVRGRLTKELLGIKGSMTLGDGGLLASTVVAKPRTRWSLGLVPHADHFGHPLVRQLQSTVGVRVVDVRQTPGRVVREIAACDVVVSTSLHGLIIADSFGIPAAWATLEPELMGGTFKFEDYESGITPGVTRRVPLHARMNSRDLIALTHAADPNYVARSIEALTAAIQGLPTSAELPFLSLAHR